MKVGAYEGLKKIPFSNTLADARFVIDRLKTGIRNACWLRQNQKTKISSAGLKFYEINPYVTVDKLVNSLLGEQLFSLEEWNKQADKPVDVQLTFDIETGVLNGQITNRHPTKRFLMTAGNIGTFFEIQHKGSNESEALLPITLLTDSLNLLENNTSDFAVSFNLPNTNDDYTLYFFFGQNKEQAIILPI